MKDKLMSVIEYVKQNPVQTGLIAAGVIVAGVVVTVALRNQPETWDDAVEAIAQTASE